MGCGLLPRLLLRAFCAPAGRTENVARFAGRIAGGGGASSAWWETAWVLRSRFRPDAARDESRIPDEREIIGSNQTRELIATDTAVKVQTELSRNAGVPGRAAGPLRLDRAGFSSLKQGAA